MPEWTIEVTDPKALKSLEDSFTQDQISEHADTRMIVKEEVDRIGSVKISVLSNEHPPPHFRVSYHGETANYEISDCAKLNGDLDRFDGNIQRWCIANKSVLIEAWNRNRPTDCPVGEYRD